MFYLLNWFYRNVFLWICSKLTLDLMSPHLFKPRENKWLKRPKHLSKTARDTGQKTTELQAQFAIWTSQSLFNTVQNCIFSPIVRKARIFFLIQHMSQLAYMHVFVFLFIINGFKYWKRNLFISSRKRIGVFTTLLEGRKRWSGSTQIRMSRKPVVRGPTLHSSGAAFPRAYIWQLKEPTFVCCYGLKSPNCFCLL